MTGYESLRTHAARLDASTRGRIRVTGEDRARLLHAMTTGDVQALKPGDGCYAFFLSAQGRILGDANILCFADHLLIDTEPETRAKLYQHLDKFIIADDATLEDVTDSTACIVLEGPAAGEALAARGVPVPAAEFGHVAWGSRTVARLSLTGFTGFFLIAPALERTEIIEALRAPEADHEAFMTVRLENGKARYGEDISERYLAQETNQMHAVAFGKGCYLGQEIVERVRSRAQIHRRLLPLRVETPTPPAAGTKFHAGEKAVADITSAAYSPALGVTMALAYVRTDAKPGDVLTSGDIRATVLAGASPGAF